MGRMPYHKYLTLLIILGRLFADLYYQIYNLVRLTQAIEYNQEAIDLTPKGNPRYLNNLSTHLRMRYGREGKQEDDRSHEGS